MSSPQQAGAPDSTAVTVNLMGDLPSNVSLLAATFKPGISFLTKLAQIQDPENHEKIAKLAPSPELKPKMKYPIVESDRLIPFLQQVVSSFGLRYTRVSVCCDVEPGGRRVLQRIFYFAWCAETCEGQVYQQDWTSDDTHNDQAGGLTRAHRRFLKGLTGFIEKDEDKLEELTRTNAAGRPTRPPQQRETRPVEEPLKPTGNAAYDELRKQADEVFSRPLGPPMGPPPTQDPNVPQETAAGAQPTGAGGGAASMLEAKGFSADLALQIGSMSPQSMISTLAETNNVRADLAEELVGSVTNGQALNSVVVEGCKQHLFTALGDTFPIAFEGTGWSPALGTDPTGEALLAAMIKTPINLPF